MGLPSFGGNGVPYRVGLEAVSRVRPGPEQAAAAVATWAAANSGLIVIAAMLHGIVFRFLSLVAQGGIARATADTVTENETTMRRASIAGLRLFWHYPELWLLLIDAAIVVAALVGDLVAATVVAGEQVDVPIRIITALVVGIPLVLVLCWWRSRPAWWSASSCNTRRGRSPSSRIGPIWWTPKPKHWGGAPVS